MKKIYNHTREKVKRCYIEGLQGVNIILLLFKRDEKGSENKGKEKGWCCCTVVFGNWNCEENGMRVFPF